MVPIVIGAATWGQEWRGRTVRAWYDNAAVVSAINLRGINNISADALSRNDLPLFRSYHPQANPEPTATPTALLDIQTLDRAVEYYF